MVHWVEVRVKARGDLAAVLQLRRQGGRGWRGSKPPEWLHHIAPRITQCCRTWAQLKEVRLRPPWRELTRRERWRFRVRFGQNTRLPTAGTETPFSLKLYIFHFKFCNIASSLILRSFPLLVFRLFLIYLYIIFSWLFFSFLTLQNERQNDGRLTIYIIIFLFLISAGVFWPAGEVSSFVVNNQVDQPQAFLSSAFALSLPRRLLHCRRALICLEVLSSFRCRVVYLVGGSRWDIWVLLGHRNPGVHTHLSAFRRPSTLLDGCSFSTLMHPFICRYERSRLSQRNIRGPERSGD